MPYRKIDTRMWDDEKVIDLDAPTKHVWSYLLTGKHTTSLPGLWSANAVTIADGLRCYPAGLVEAALVELERLGMIERDLRLRLIRVPNAPKYNQAENVGVVKSWWSQWKALPECALKYLHVDSLRLGVVADRALDAWTVLFGKVEVDQNLARFANDSRSHLESIREAPSNRSPAPDPDLCSDLDPSQASPDPDQELIQDPGGIPREAIFGAMPEIPDLDVPPPPPVAPTPDAPPSRPAAEGPPMSCSVADALAVSPPSMPAQAPRPLPPSEGLPPGVRMRDSRTRFVTARPDVHGASAPTSPSSPDAEAILARIERHPGLASVATSEFADRLAGSMLTNKKTLAAALESIDAAAEIAADRKAIDQDMSPIEIASLVRGFATKPKPARTGSRSRASPTVHAPSPYSTDQARRHAHHPEEPLTDADLPEEARA